GLSFRQLGAEGFAVILDENDITLRADTLNRTEIACEPKHVGDEQTFQFAIFQSLEQGSRRHIESIDLAINRYRFEAELDNRHHVRGPCQRREADFGAGLETAHALETLQHDEIGAAAAVEKDRMPPSLLGGKNLLETQALLPHAQLVGRSYEIGQSFLRFLLAQERIFHQRYHDLTFRP